MCHDDVHQDSPLQFLQSVAFEFIKAVGTADLLSRLPALSLSAKPLSQCSIKFARCEKPGAAEM